LKLTRSLKILLTSLELGEPEDPPEHQEPPKTEKLKKNLVEKLTDSEVKKKLTKPVIRTTL